MTTTTTAPAVCCVPDPDLALERRAWVAAWCVGASALGVLARPVHRAGVVVMTAPDGRALGLVDYLAPTSVTELAALLAYTHAGACAAWEAADDVALALLAATTDPALLALCV